MTATPEQLFARLDEIGIPHRTVAHAAVFTVEEAKAHRGEIEGGHTKNLFLKDKKDRLFLAVTLEDVPVDLKALSPMVASGRLSFAAPDLLRGHLGVEPGSVTPFALINDRDHSVTPLLDEAMLEFATLSFHPLVNTATTTIASADLVRFVKACGHNPLILRFPRRLEVGIS
jgi:Ala-tRNA(Pro) deacylase